MAFETLLSSVVVGVASSLTTVGCLYLWKQVTWVMKYPRLAGVYRVRRPDGTFSPEAVELTYLGGRHFATRSCARAADGSWGDEWEGVLQMDRQFPWCGEGIFHTAISCGVHKVQVRTRDWSIFVMGVNTAGGTVAVPFLYTLQRAA